MFQGDSTRQYSKILVAPVPEGSRSMSLPLRPLASRSSEDLLRDSSWLSGEEVVDEPVCVSPSLPCRESSTGSSVLDSLNSESLTCNSALESPDSWADSDLAVMVETFGENQSVCSACDSGVACDCAKPVESSTLEESFIPSVEEETPPVDNEAATAESGTDEAVDFQSSSKRSQEEVQGYATHQEAVEVRREDDCSENQTGDSNPVEELTKSNRVEVTNIIASEEVDSSSCPKDEALREEALPLKPVDAEELISCDDGTGATAVSQHFGNTEVPTPEKPGEQNVTERVNSETKLLEKADEQNNNNNPLHNEAQISGKTENQNEVKLSEDVEPDFKSHIHEASSDLQGSFQPVTSDSSVKTQSLYQEQPSPTPLDPSHARSSALRSTSTEQEEQDFDRTRDLERNVTKENEDFGCNQTDVDDKKEIESRPLFSPVIENDEPTTSLSLEDTNRTETNKLSSEDVLPPGESQIQESTTEPELEESSHARNADKKVNIQTSFGNAESESMETECGTNQQDGQQDRKMNDGTTYQQDTVDPVDPVPLEQSSLRTVSEDGLILNDSQIYDSVGDSVEPMDIFYPEKEDPVSSEPIDMEMQGWPLVLSVSALQPAPATDTLQDAQPLNLVEEDLLNVESLSEQVGGKVNAVRLSLGPLYLKSGIASMRVVFCRPCSKQTHGNNTLSV